MNKTLSYYNQNASTYFERTINIPLGLAYPYLTSRVPAGGSILDLGSGSGRDSRYFIDAGYKVTSVDGSWALAAVAKERLNVDVKVMMFEDLDSVSIFDGVWASSSLLHLNDSCLARVLSNIERSLKPGGFFYASFKFGDGEITDALGRYFRLHNFKTLPPVIEASTGLKLLRMERTYSYTQGVSTEWLHMVAKKVPVVLTRLEKAISTSPCKNELSSLVSTSRIDIAEVIDSLANFVVEHSLNIEEVEACRFAKSIRSGSFEKGLVLKSSCGRTGKLVRDGYLDILSAEGRADEGILVDKVDLVKEHCTVKLQEELKRLAHAITPSARIEEMANVLEVIECILRIS